MKKHKVSRGAVRQKAKGRKLPRKVTFPKLDFKPILLWVGKLLLLIVLSAGAYALWPQLNRPVAEVEFAGDLDRVDRALLRRQVEENANSGLLMLNIEELDSRVEEIDWVYAAEVQKSWPQRLSIHIEEEQPVARWGQQGYLAASGKMVRSEAYEELNHLPVFDVQVADPREALDLFYGLNAAMLTNGIGIRELRQSQFGSWSMVMENDCEIQLGKDDLIVRMRRVMQAWQILAPDHLDELEAVDARYPNGIAVKYRKQIVQLKTPLNGGWKT